MQQQQYKKLPSDSQSQKSMSSDQSLLFFRIERRGFCTIWGSPPISNIEAGAKNISIVPGSLLPGKVKVLYKSESNFDQMKNDPSHEMDFGTAIFPSWHIRHGSGFFLHKAAQSFSLISITIRNRISHYFYVTFQDTMQPRFIPFR
jgi:hypothetical protein